MRTGKPVNFPNHPESGHALACTVAVLALVGVVQLLLFAKTPPPQAPPAAKYPPEIQPKPAAPTVPAATEKKAPMAGPPASPLPEQDKPAPPASGAPAVAAVPIPAPELPDFLPPLETNATKPPSTGAVEQSPVGPAPKPGPESPVKPEAESPAPVVAADPSVLPRDELKLLVAEAVRMRRAGDMAGAIGKINAAIDAEPGHPRLLFELAATYEAMGMTERALDAYRNVAEMGPQGAGTLLPIVERRLKEGLEEPGSRNLLDEPLHLGAVEEIPQPGDDGETRIVRFDIHARPGAAIDPTRLTVPVKFFDVVNGRQIEPSLADAPEVRWVTPPVDWKEPGVETVEVTYHLPAARQEYDGSRRKYLGYRVELYYQDALLDVMARPRRLAVFQDAPTAPSVEPGATPDLPDTLPELLPETLGGPLLGP